MSDVESSKPAYFPEISKEEELFIENAKRKDEVERLKAKCRELELVRQSEVALLKEAVEVETKSLNAVEYKVRRMEAKLAKARKALEKIEQVTRKNSGELACWCVKTALKALAEIEKDGDE